MPKEPPIKWERGRRPKATTGEQKSFLVFHYAQTHFSPLPPTSFVTFHVVAAVITASLTASDSLASLIIMTKVREIGLNSFPGRLLWRTVSNLDLQVEGQAAGGLRLQSRLGGV